MCHRLVHSLGKRNNFSDDQRLCRYSSKSFKSAIAGAAAGYLTYKGGKYIIRSATEPMMLDDHVYYWDDSFYIREYNMQKCSMAIERTTNDTTMTLGNVFFDNGTRPTHIVWSCSAQYQRCCEFDCCYHDQGSGILTLLSNDTDGNDTRIVSTSESTPNKTSTPTAVALNTTAMASTTTAVSSTHTVVASTTTAVSSTHTAVASTTIASTPAISTRTASKPSTSATTIVTNSFAVYVACVSSLILAHHVVDKL